jgi:mRNA interferase RelE/StbE
VTYAITLTPAAARQLRKLEPATRRRIQAVFETLAVNPRPPGATQLVGTSDWRVRTGSYRIVYEINDGTLFIIVVTIGHRRDVYNR